MKATTCLLAGLAGLFAPAATLCATTVDVEKEKGAIIAVIEEEKNAYLALDDARMAATWIQQPTSLKVYVFGGKEERYDGYAAIAAHDRENLVRARALGAAHQTRFEFSHARVTLQGDSAWLTCNARWEGLADGAPAVGTQARVYVLRREHRRWKIALLAISQLTFEKKAGPATSRESPSAPARFPSPAHGYRTIPSA
jgi:ketosteroid isomerase-like protein